MISNEWAGNKPETKLKYNKTHKPNIIDVSRTHPTIKRMSETAVVRLQKKSKGSPAGGGGKINTDFGEK